jgi:uncharacterized protein YutE (UPF0331/DUF86 family)
MREIMANKKSSYWTGGKKLAPHKTAIKRRAGKSTPISSIREDDEVISSVLSRIKRLLKQHDPDSLFREMSSMQASRISRTIKVHDVLAASQHRLIEANLQNSAFRSRVVEIRTNITRTYIIIEDLIDRCKKYIRHQYSSELKAKFPTVGERSAFIDSVMNREKTQLVELGSIMDICDIFIEDYDQGGWSYKRIGEILQLSHSVKTGG